jgi:hypothetical protein
MRWQAGFNNIELQQTMIVNFQIKKGQNPKVLSFFSAAGLSMFEPFYGRFEGD